MAPPSGVVFLYTTLDWEENHLTFPVEKLTLLFLEEQTEKER